MCAHKVSVYANTYISKNFYSYYVITEKRVRTACNLVDFSNLAVLKTILVATIHWQEIQQLVY